MDEKRKSVLVCLIIGAVICALVVAINWRLEQHILRRLSDCTFVSAVLLLGSGGLKFARNQGTFDIMSYGLKSALEIHFPFSKMDKPLSARQESFADYKERKRQKRKGASDLLWAGLVYLVLAIVFTVLYSIIVGVNIG